MSGRNTRKINRTNARLPAADIGTRARNGVRFDPMGNGGREIQSPAPESQRGSEFSMESANDKIRARPFRHTKFQNVSARLHSSYSGRVPPFLAAPSRRGHEIGATWNAVRGIYPSSSSSRYLIFMKDSGSQTRSRRKTVGEEMTTVYRARRKRGKLGRKGSDGESDFKALSLVNSLRWKILRRWATCCDEFCTSNELTAKKKCTLQFISIFLLQHFIKFPFKQNLIDILIIL